MKFIYCIKRPIMWLILITYVYFWSCRLWFENAYVTPMLQLPFLLALPIDLFVLWNKRKEIPDILKHYILKNKVIFISVVMFVFCDIVTFFYARALSYAGTKYELFLRTIYVLSSIFLCCYEDDAQKMKENVESLIRCICCVLVMFVVTTVIRWSLGLAPYWERISLCRDYNVFARYFIFSLIFYIFYYIKWEGSFSGLFKIVYFVCEVLAIDLILLTGSRRAVVLCPIVITVSFFFYVLRRILKEKQKKHDVKNFKVCIGILGLALVLAGNMYFSVPLFEKYVSLTSEEKKAAHMNFMLENTMIDDSSNDNIPVLSEVNLAARYQSIGSEQGLAKRDVIWEVALYEIKKMNLSEMLFGKGSGYSWKIYENEENEGVEQLLELYGREEPEPKWMSPHNFFLTEFLEGGLFKIIMSLCVFGAVFYSLVQYMRKNAEYGLMLLLVYGCLGANFMMGTTNGLLGEDLFWLSTGFLILLRSNERYKDEIIALKKE